MEKRKEKRRIVLVPLSGQGHVTPIMQLGKALNLKGFSITVVEGHYNQVSSSSHQFPGFQFITIRESLPESEFERIGPIKFLLKLNKTSEASFKDCIGELLLQHGNDIACIIYDEFVYFCAAAAKEFNLPSIIFSTTSATHKVCSSVLGKLNVEKFLLDMKDHKMQNQVVKNLHLFPYKELTYEMGPLEPLFELCREVADKRSASAIITNTSSCLESSSLSWLEHEFGIPIYDIGPLHITASIPTSILEEDGSCIEWLDKQKPRSVMYISVGTIAQMETKEVLEMALGLCDSNQPFLWVIRPGSIPGFNGTESLPEEVSKKISERGYIVKWAPQIQVLGHPAVGGFWSHCGWNSTLESIVEGVPMICRPFHGEQKVNATYVERVLRMGIQIGGEVERGVVERAVKRLIVEEKGEGMRKRALNLKEKLKASVRSGGSSYNALDMLVKYLNTK